MQNSPKDTVLIDGFRFRKSETTFFNDLFFDESDIIFCCILGDTNRYGGTPVIAYNRKLNYGYKDGYQAEVEKIAVFLEVTSKGISVDSVVGSGWIDVSNTEIQKATHYTDWRDMIRFWLRNIKEDWCFVNRELLINKIEQ